MLVLTRSSDQEIRIGDDIVVRVLDVKGDRVRIGIDAPMEVPVHRQEVYLEIERANRESMVVASGGLAGVGELLGNKARGRASTSKKNKKNGTAGNRKRPVAVSTEVSHGS